MARYLRIIDSQVLNAEEWENDPSEDGVVFLKSDIGGPGWSYVGGLLSPPAPTAPVVPAKVNAYYAKYVLFAQGLYDPVKAAVAAAGPGAGFYFDNAPEWLRSDSFVNALAPALGLVPAQIDAMFIAADAAQRAAGQ